MADGDERDEAPQTPPLQLLDTPRDGIPPVVTQADELDRVIAAFAAGSGPIAVDAERASGHRYGQRAFLVQLRREGAGTALIDPAALPDLSALGAAIRDVEWVLHAAGQDLPCLAELGLRPTLLFDTELGSRLAGFSRVGLAAVVEQLLGLGLAKEHSAVDWSTRPLPEPWLRYAALDVEVLVDLRNVLAEELAGPGQAGLGPSGVRRDRRRPAHPGARGPVAAHVGPAQAAHPARSWPRSASCGRRASSSPASRTSPPGG